MGLPLGFPDWPGCHGRPGPPRLVIPFIFAVLAVNSARSWSWGSSDMLHRLRYQNVRDLDAFPLPEFGELDVIGLQDAEYSFS